MKNVLMNLCTGVFMSILCVGFVACNENKDNKPKEPEPGLGEEIPGLEVKQATGTIIGSYTHGFGSLLVQVGEEFPIGETVELFDRFPCNINLSAGTYQNVIQVQWKLPLAVSGDEQISFSFRKYQEEKDRDLFTIGAGHHNMLYAPPSVPIYVITKYAIMNN